MSCALLVTATLHEHREPSSLLEALHKIKQTKFRLLGVDLIVVCESRNKLELDYLYLIL